MCNYISQLAAGYFYRGIHTCTCILYIVHNKLTLVRFKTMLVRTSLSAGKYKILGNYE